MWCRSSFEVQIQTHLKSKLNGSGLDWLNPNPCCSSLNEKILYLLLLLSIIKHFYSPHGLDIQTVTARLNIIVVVKWNIFFTLCHDSMFKVPQFPSLWSITEIIIITVLVQWKATKDGSREDPVTVLRFSVSCSWKPKPQNWWQLSYLFFVPEK